LEHPDGFREKGGVDSETEERVHELGGACREAEVVAEYLVENCKCDYRQKGQDGEVQAPEDESEW
jgi:hypothetical protein